MLAMIDTIHNLLCRWENKSVMNDAKTTPLLPQTLDEPQLEPDNDKKTIESNSITQPNQQGHPWLIPFLVNIFLGYASSSIVQPSLAPYLKQIGIPESYLPWAIFMSNIGGVVGSLMGLFYDYATRICQVEGRGAKISLLICPLVGAVGSALYACAGWVGDMDTARWFILVGRLFHGIWRSGQTSVEQGEEDNYFIYCIEMFRVLCCHTASLTASISPLFYSVFINGCWTISQNRIHCNTRHLCSPRYRYGT